MQGSILRLKEFSEIPNAFIPNSLPIWPTLSPLPHHRCWVWEDSNGQIDYFVATVGTGGTISGVGGYLKSKKSSIEVIAVEPAGSPLLSTGIAGKHQIQGIGAGFIPATLNTKIYDSVITVEDEEAFEAARSLARHEGILAGISSGVLSRGFEDYSRGVN